MKEKLWQVQDHIHTSQDRVQIINWKNPDRCPFLIHYHSKNVFGQVTSHWHKEFEITCMFDGKADFYNGGIKRTIESPGVNISNVGVVHFAVTRMEDYVSKYDGEYGGFTLMINHGTMNRLIPDFDDIYFELDSEETELRLYEYMVKIYELSLEGDTTPVRLRILGIIAEMMALLYEKCRKSRELLPINVQKDKERIKIILDYLNKNYTMGLNQAELAKKFHFSREYFSRFFKVQTGMSYKEYIMRYRVEKAREDIENTKKTVMEIAYQHGFNSETQFIIWFKKIYQLPPAKYRKELEKL